MMLIFNDIESLMAFRGSRRCAVTIGNFDGCHKGHQALCHELHRYESSSELIQDPPLTVALTFDPHPALALGHYTHIKRLQTLNDRLETLGSYGIDVVLKVEFNKDIATLDATSFVKKFLVAGASAAIIAVGQDFKFGRGRSGNVDLLEKMSRENNYRLNLLQPLKIKGEVASSTLVRRIIAELGDFSQVKELLGRSWFFRGTVIHGRKLGRTIGFPTANLDIGDIVSPRPGVFCPCLYRPIEFQ
ncbi:MAG: hypothetical protein NTV34_18540 [Proteobacteria bacterium]|nr:hypothetical protein [Pseudomonadota bacterium]